MDEEQKKMETWELVGERLSLDFANTVNWSAGQDAREHLSAYERLVAWAVYTGALPEGDAELLKERASRETHRAAAVLERAFALRRALQQVVRATIEGQEPAQEALEIVNEELAQAMPHLRLTPDEDGFHWHWEQGSGALDAMLWPVVQDAADLLTEGETLERVKQCDGATCTWPFLDTSRNRSRRWCSMESCGNRAKARRHYRRQKKADS